MRPKQKKAPSPVRLSQDFKLFTHTPFPPRKLVPIVFSVTHPHLFKKGKHIALISLMFMRVEVESTVKARDTKHATRDATGVQALLMPTVHEHEGGALHHPYRRLM